MIGLANIMAIMIISITGIMMHMQRIQLLTRPVPITNMHIIHMLTSTIMIMRIDTITTTTMCQQVIIRFLIHITTIIKMDIITILGIIIIPSTHNIKVFT